MMKIFFSALLLSILALFPSSSRAQWAVSPQVVISIPKSNFANVDGTGGGFGVKAVRQTDWLGRKLGIRGDFAFLTFGKERAFDPFLGYSVELRNEGFRLTFGPEYKTGGRKLKFYLGANGGLYFFRLNVTSQIFDPFGNSASFFDSRNNNWALGWNGSIGVQYDIGLGPWLDLNFEYQTMHNLPASTVDPNSDTPSEPNPDAQIPDITAHEYTIKVGVIFFLGR